MNREVAILSIDTTDVKVDQSSDAFAQMQTYSGDRGKGIAICLAMLLTTLVPLLQSHQAQT